MIEILKLTKWDENRLVIYKKGASKQEEGIITSWNSKFIFVRYHGDIHSKATAPEDLNFIRKAKPNEQSG